MDPGSGAGMTEGGGASAQRIGSPGPPPARPFEGLRMSDPSPGMDSRSGSGMTGGGGDSRLHRNAVKGQGYSHRRGPSLEGRFDQTLPLTIQYGFHLRPFDTGKPLQELTNRRAILEVFEEGVHRHPCASKHPNAAHPLRVSFDGGARLPGGHNWSCPSQCL